MKQFYLFFMAAILAVCLGVMPASAQTASDYTVRIHGDPYVPLSDPTTVYTSPHYYDYYMQSGIPEVTIPFNIKYFDLVTNKIKVTCHGDIIVQRDASWSNAPSGIQIYYPGLYPQHFSIQSGVGRIPCATVNTSYYSNSYYYYTQVASTEFISSPYLYSANYTIFPWHRGYIVYSGDIFTGGGPFSTVQTQTIGSAPNRRFIVQWVNQRGGGYLPNNTNPIQGEFQVEFFEQSTTNPTKIRFNYNPLVFPQEWDGYAVLFNSVMPISSSSTMSFRPSEHNR